MYVANMCVYIYVCICLKCCQWLDLSATLRAFELSEASLLLGLALGPLLSGATAMIVGGGENNIVIMRSEGALCHCDRCVLLTWQYVLPRSAMFSSARLSHDVL